MTTIAYKFAAGVHMRSLRNFFFSALFVLGLGSILYFGIHQGGGTIIFSPPQMLSALWSNYKKVYIQEPDGRTIDPGRNNQTTSEGQSYTMLRAVWMGDKETFDASWAWTRETLWRNDHVFSWLFGERADGTYGVLSDEGGTTSASDADVDIALSLVFAYARWQDPAYLSAASSTIVGIWNADVITIQGVPYLSADSLEKTSTNEWAAINPSYLSPAAFRIFAAIDPAHPWMEVVDSSYVILERSMSSALDKGTSTGLPPDWIRMHKKTGAIEALYTDNNTTDFGYNALRVPWRLALDWQWFHDSRDEALLKKFSFLSEQWKSKGSLAAIYTHDGLTAENADYESSAMYGGTIGYFMVADPVLAPIVYERKLESLFNPDNNTWQGYLSYYDDNWAWFGIALYNHLLPNIAATLPGLSMNHAGL